MSFALGWALVLLGIVILSAGATPPCHCEELTVSGAADPAVNGTYTYTQTSPDSWPSYWEGSRLWLGDVFLVAPPFTAYWAVVQIGGRAWVAGVLAALSDGEWVIYVIGDYYSHPDGPKCPPETGWMEGYLMPSSFAIARSGCLGAGIGDVNGDGTTDLLDVRLVYEHVVSATRLPDDMVYWADVDDDGDVDDDDIRAMGEQLIGTCP